MVVPAEPPSAGDVLLWLLTTPEGFEGGGAGGDALEGMVGGGQRCRVAGAFKQREVLCLAVCSGAAGGAPHLSEVQPGGSAAAVVGDTGEQGGADESVDQATARA